MGVFRSTRRLMQQSKEARERYPTDQLISNGLASMQQMNSMLEGMNAQAAATTGAIKDGVASTATISAVRMVNAVMNITNHAVDLDLVVMTPAGVPVPVSRREFVPLLHVHRLQVGTRLKVMVDPSDPNALWIDWDSPVS
jgi:hypothetical protein